MYVYICMHVCICIHIYAHIDIPRALSMEETIKSMFSLLVYTHTHTHVYKWIHTCKYVYIYIHTCTYIYTYICPHIQTESVVDGRDNQVDVLFIGHQRRRDVDVVVEGVKAPVGARENHALYQLYTQYTHNPGLVQVCWYSVVKVWYKVSQHQFVRERITLCTNITHTTIVVWVCWYGVVEVWYTVLQHQFAHERITPFTNMTLTTIVAKVCW